MSASPSPSAAGENKPAEQVRFRFCRECSNLLYPKEDRANNRLMFTCRTCHVGEPASSYCVYQNNLTTQVGDTAGVTQDVGSDPTVSAPGFCLLCGDEITCFICASISNHQTPKDEHDELCTLLPRSNKLCPSCGEAEAVFFQSQQRSAETGMKLYYVCCHCGNVFT
ncbi:hypothetical protein FE257_011339 [Aspergillus nanangensis]|uniref:DNA-directed RNA polymerase II subunit RPB9 n=1 Tax=Aspergillus nanangensis TaxID=2582783 RepID=A0AAD4CHS4_ASPNN|nr:hypothetical protein FE257_011339 [Aspergillus nanangensis]